jgi:translocation and assembly module TamA
VRTLTRLVCLVCLLGLIGPGRAAAAQTPLYDVDLRMPAAERSLLEDNLDLYRWRGNERMDEAQMRRLVRMTPDQIRSLLATEGFYSPQVAVRLERADKTWMVHLEVTPGEPVRVHRIDLEVTGPFDDGSSANRERLARMRSDWALSAGAVFRDADWEAAKRAALGGLLLDRYPAATIRDSRATVDPKAGTADLRLVLDSGPAFTLGRLQITGLKRYPRSIIERLNLIKPGDPYKQASLLELQSRLQNSPYFAGAEVHVATDPAHPLEVPVQVAVEENHARKLGFGIGMSTDSGPRGQVTYQDLNLLGRAWRLSGTAKVDTKEQSLDSKLQFPLTAQGYQDALTASLKRNDLNGEVTRSLALGATRTHIRGKNQLDWGLSYLRELQDVAGAPGSHSASLVLSRSLIRRDVDNLVFPSRGYLLKLEGDAAAHALLSDRSFLRSDAKAVWFHTLGQHGQLILRGELGAVLASGRDGIPSDLLFQTGGDQTVRGYAYQSIGVRQGDAIVGGRLLATASGEYVHWLTAQWGAAVFVDAGDAADRLADLSAKVGYGVGARWKSPIGPLNLDVAYGEANRQVRVHFAVGFGF